MKIAAIVPVKTFSNAKTRLKLPQQKIEELCLVMLEEIVQVLRVSPHIEEVVLVTREQKAIELGGRHNATVIIDDKEQNVNHAIALADKYLLENDFDASIVLPQDIPFVKTQDIDFMLNYKIPPNFAVIVPSRRFDGTNALIRMPVDLMQTHYDEDSYKIHMNVAKKYTRNVAMVFVKRIMWDIDNVEDIEFLSKQNEKPMVQKRIREILESD